MYDWVHEIPPRLADIQPEKISLVTADIEQGEYFASQNKDGLLVRSIIPAYGINRVTQYDNNFNKLWSFELEMNCGVALVNDAFVLTLEKIIIGYRDNDTEYPIINNKFKAYTKSGVLMWESEEIDSSFYIGAYYAGPDGEVFVLGRRQTNGELENRIRHYSNSGVLLSEKSFPYAHLFGYTDTDGEFWLYTSDDKWLNLAPDMSIKNGILLPGGYPAVRYYSEDQSFVYYGNKYAEDTYTLLGFINTAEINGEATRTLNTFNLIPQSVARLKNGNFAVSFRNYNRHYDTYVYIFDEDWNKIAEIDVSYEGYPCEYIYVFALEDGGFALGGKRLSLVENVSSTPEEEIIKGYDWVIEIYSADYERVSRKTILCEENPIGRNYGIYINEQGTVLLY